MDSAPRGGGGGRRGGRYGDHGGADYGRSGRGAVRGDYDRGGGGGYGRGGGGDYGRGGGRDYGRGGAGGGRGGEYTRGGRGGSDYGGGGRGGEYGRGGGRVGGVRGLGRQMDRLSLNESAAIPAAKPLFKKATPLPSKDDLTTLKPPKRPGYGTIGKKVMVRANHFMVRVAEALVIFHYDVSVDMVGATRPVTLSTSVNRAVLSMFVQHYGESHLDNRLIAYDGRKNIYSVGPLPAADGKSFVVKRTSDKDGRENEYTVIIRLVAKLDLKALNRFLRKESSECPQDVIQALDVVLRTKPSQDHLSFSRSFFFTHESHHAGLGNGVECWKGYYQSLRPTQMGLSLNIDQSATSFLEPKMVLDFLRDYLNLRDFSRQLSATDFVKIKKILKNVKVETSHGPGVIVYRIRGLTALPANQLKFAAQGGIELSVAQYFQEKYKFNLTYPSLPCLLAGTDKKPTYLPMEVCKIIPGQRYNKKLNENQVRNMLYLTCSNPSIRANTIAGMSTDNHYEQDPFAKEFGIIVRNELKMVEGRLLPPPMLKYGGSSRNAVLRPSNGAWNMRGQRMEIGAIVEHWAFVNLSSRIYAEDADRLCSGLVSMCREIGMQFSNSPIVMNCHPRSGESVDAALRKIKLQSDESLARLGKSNQNLQLLIIILPEESFYYGFIKRVCETELGVVSQCIHTKNVHKANPQYCANVALKINVKVGGRNTLVNEYQDADITKSPPPRLLNPGEIPVSIIFGADVTHPQPGEDSSPSLAAVVASMDWPGMSKYRSAVSSQAHRQEIISDLYTSSVDASGKLIHGGLIRELLRSFYSLNAQRKPDRIIFFRDGVSEGQFADVLLYEMHAIRKACKSLQDNYSPFVTFIVVQKRHHTRLFPLPQEREMIDKSGNILPGTVVEKEICHPTEFDFYLCSHAGLKGTSRPTHYHVLYDENLFTADELQLLTYRLCYTFARCTRSVSIVPAAYYAHLAAFRARHYIDGDASDGGSTVAGTADSGGEVLVRDLPKIKDNVKEVMFFC